MPPKKTAAGRKKSAPSHTQKPVIGWKEWVRFPELGVEGIRSKVDTGARTSALHATGLKESLVDGVPHVRFTVHCELEGSTRDVDIELPLVDKRPVKDSGGREEIRPVVSARVELGLEKWPIELTLTRRDDMEFNMLLGRRAVSGRFVIDPEEAFVQGLPGVGGAAGRSPAKRRSTVSKKKARTKKATKKATSRKTATKRSSAKKKPAKRPSAKTSSPRKTSTRKPSTKKAPAKRSSTRKTSAKKTSTKKPSAKKKAAPKGGTKP